jgi:hypothetical protein
VCVKYVWPFLIPVALALLTVACGSSTVPKIEAIVTVESQSVPTRQSDPTPTNVPTPSQSGRTCTLTGGEVVQDGWSGKDTGSNFCNRCFCTDGALGCTKIACQDNSNPIMSVPRLQNLLLENLGPYDQESSTFGDLKYDMRFGGLVFHDFGRIRIDGRGVKHYNPTFEFIAPAGTRLIAPVSGVISYFEWQSSQGDWEIHIKPTGDSEWRFGIDHIVSLDCSRSTNPDDVCSLPLKIAGRVLFEGTAVNAGDVIGYIGTWSDYENIGINGRTELTIFKYLDGFTGTMSYCPTMYLVEEVESVFVATISELMQSYEEWSGKASTYDQGAMVAPGCLYEAINQVGDITEPITK